MEPGRGSPSDPWYIDSRFAARGQPMSRIGYTADLSATIHASDGPATVLGTGHSEALGAKGACEAASERLAKAMAERVSHP